MRLLAGACKVVRFLTIPESSWMWGKLFGGVCTRTEKLICDGNCGYKNIPPGKPPIFQSQARSKSRTVFFKASPPGCLLISYRLGTGAWCCGSATLLAERGVIPALWVFETAVGGLRGSLEAWKTSTENLMRYSAVKNSSNSNIIVIPFTQAQHLVCAASLTTRLLPTSHHYS